MLEELKDEVYRANMLLPKYNLITFTWGNVSGIDREKGLFVIKPSGVEYDLLKPSDMVVVDLKGKKVEGELNPSSDTLTHLELYLKFPTIGGVTHTHSTHATTFAQAAVAVPALGTTHADYFYGEIPVTPPMTPAEIAADYEANTGKVITRYFAEKSIDPEMMSAVLVHKHGPFTWGKTAAKSVEAAVVLEEVAKMAFMQHSIAGKLEPMSQELLDKHYLRKHGKNAYYGQKG